jgi:zinc transport system substrate-binding protein
VYQANGSRFAVELDDLDRRLGEILSPVRGAAVVLHHPSVRYLLNRYGLRLLRVIEESPGKEPSPRYIQDLVNEMKAAGVKAVFNEPQLALRPVEVIAEAAGVPVKTLDPLGGEPGRETYSELLLFNAKALAEGTR